MTAVRLLIVAGLAAALTACSSAEREQADDPAAETWQEVAEHLRSSPTGDRPWREGLAAAQREEALDALLDLANDLAQRNPERWEPSWTAGESLLRMGRIPESSDAYTEALGRARDLEDPIGIACSANRLGFFAFRTGELDEGERLYREALAAATGERRDDLIAYIRNNLAGLLLEAGDFAGAREELERAEIGLRELGLEGPARNAAQNRAIVLYTLGDAVAARETLETVHADAVRAKDDTTRSASAVVMGHLLSDLGQDDEASQWYRRVSPDDPENRTRAELGMGLVALRRRRLDEAERLLQSAAAGAAEAGNLPLALLSETFLAEAVGRSGRTAEALEQLKHVAARADEIESEDVPWVAAWVRGQILMSAGRPAEAAIALERSVAILDEQGASLDPLEEGFHFLRQRADPYVALAVAVASDGSHDDVPSTVLELSSRAKARALRRAVGSRDRHPADPVDPAPTADANALQRSLTQGELLLDYLVADDHGIVLALSPTDARAVPIAGLKSLGQPLNRFRQELTQAVEGDAPESAPLSDEGRAAAVRLREALIDPVRDMLEGATRLYIAPDRGLALLPFEALPLELDRETRQVSRYLGDDVEVAAMPMPAPVPRWDAERSPLFLAGSPRLDADSGFPDLPWSAYELSQLSKLWGGENTVAVSGAGLTLSALKQHDLARFRTLHFATHAVASTRDPQRCAVILSDGERLGIDRIRALELRSALVVLSACRTGEGELLPGEGVVGLGWAFMLAGARGVVVSRWTVDDTSAARLMVAFHEKLHDGIEPVRALTLARRQLARTHSHPGFWAPFAIVVRPE